MGAERVLGCKVEAQPDMKWRDNWLFMAVSHGYIWMEGQQAQGCEDRWERTATLSVAQPELMNSNRFLSDREVKYADENGGEGREAEQQHRCFVRGQS